MHEGTITTNWNTTLFLVGVARPSVNVFFWSYFWTRADCYTSWYLIHWITEQRSQVHTCFLRRFGVGSFALDDAQDFTLTFLLRFPYRPVSIPKSLDDVPMYLEQNMSLGKGRTYRYSQAEALFPFGYGQGYHTAAYSNVRVTPAVVRRDSTKEISVAVDVSLLDHRLAKTNKVIFNSICDCRCFGFAA